MILGSQELQFEHFYKGKLELNQPSAGGVADLRVRSVICVSRYNTRFALLKYAILKLHLNRMLAPSLVVLVTKASPTKAGGLIYTGSCIKGFTYLDRETDLQGFLL